MSNKAALPRICGKVQIAHSCCTRLVRLGPVVAVKGEAYLVTTPFFFYRTGPLKWIPRGRDPRLTRGRQTVYRFDEN